MEEGSLLEHALKSTPQSPLPLGGSGDSESTKNVLILDIYTLDNDQDHIHHLLHLAKLTNICNARLQSKEYDFHWHYGGDGPVFGVHVGDDDDGSRIPHLRAYCRYGPSVADEWMAIQRMFTLSQDLADKDGHDVAISCWDVEDGQVILIQTADALPDWLDQNPTDTHRYACWIRKGQIQLLRESHVSLPAALEYLRNQKDPNNLGPSHPKVQNILMRSLSRIQEHAVAKQRTPLVVPRTVATAIRNRPHFIHAAIQSFCDHIEDAPPADLLVESSDWVWTTASLSRTNYAMLRTMVSSEWKTTDFIPPVGVEVKRYKRQCKMDATPHIRHAVELGVRIVVGLDLLSKQEAKWETMSVEHRIAFWSRIDEQSRNNKEEGAPWILPSYQQGPNFAKHDLTNILKCPVFPEEVGNRTLYSHPETSIKQQLLNAQKQNMDPDEEFPMPLADQVDDEAWLTLDDDKGRDGVVEGADLDNVLSRFQNFMVQPSEVEGVDIPSDTSNKDNSFSRRKPPIRKDIRPRIFLNILHSVLKGNKLSFPQSEDPFFYKEDYDLLEEEAAENDDEDDDAEKEESAMMRGLMVSLQQCLRF